MTRRRRALCALVVAAILCLSGCASPLGPVSTAGPTTDAPATADGSTDLGPRAGERVRVPVVGIVDGDTVRVEYADGTRETVRLLGIDTPETRGDTNPAEFPGVPDTEAGRACLSTWADRATANVTERLADREVWLVMDAESDRRGAYGRLLAYLVPDAGGPNASINYALVAGGYARVYESSFTNLTTYHEAEAAARAANRGLWGCANDTASGPLSLVDVHADADGNDNENLDDEYLVFRNPTDESLALGGWTVRDAAGHVYEFPADFSLASGASVTLHTGSGTDTASDLYWGASGAVWNNGGDTVEVRDANGSVVLSRQYR